MRRLRWRLRRKVRFNGGFGLLLVTDNLFCVQTDNLRTLSSVLFSLGCRRITWLDFDLNKLTLVGPFIIILHVISLSNP